MAPSNQGDLNEARPVASTWHIAEMWKLRDEINHCKKAFGGRVIPQPTQQQISDGAAESRGRRSRRRRRRHGFPLWGEPGVPVEQPRDKAQCLKRAKEHFSNLYDAWYSKIETSAPIWSPELQCAFTECRREMVELSRVLPCGPEDRKVIEHWNYLVKMARGEKSPLLLKGTAQHEEEKDYDGEDGNDSWGLTKEEIWGRRRYVEVGSMGELHLFDAYGARQ